jgi:hypothetical protein
MSKSPAERAELALARGSFCRRGKGLNARDFHISASGPEPASPNLNMSGYEKQNIYQGEGLKG